MKASLADPKPLTFALLRLLADGEFHSGETMARQLDVSRAGVHNALQGIEPYGLTLHRVRGRGYRLVSTVQWLEARRVAQQLGAQHQNFVIELLDCAPSSNTLLLQRAAQGAPKGSVLAVEWQSAGRGRMGRRWHSGLVNALTFSLLWRFERGLASLSGLSLAAGVALMRGLRSLGVEQAQLKWPNDVLDKRGAKLAGILIEAQGDMLGPAAAVIGIGMNVSLPPQLEGDIAQPAVSLAAMTDASPDRNRLLAVLLRELGSVLASFEIHGFTAIREEWERHHALQNRRVVLLLPGGESVTGVARGVTDEGALKLETDRGMQIFHAGEISLRAHAAA